MRTRQNILVAVVAIIVFIFFITLTSRYGDRAICLGIFFVAILIWSVIWQFLSKQPLYCGPAFGAILYLVILFGILLLAAFAISRAIGLEATLLIILPVFISIILAVALFYWGPLLRAQGRLDLAEQHYTNLLRLNSRSGFLYMQRGGMRQEKGDYQDALDDFKRAIEIAEAKASRKTPSRFSVNYDLGTIYISIANIYFQQGQYEVAIEECNKGLARQDVLPIGKSVIRFNRGFFSLANMDYETALADFEHLTHEKLAIQVEKAIGSQIQFGRSVALWGLNRVAEAKTIWQQLLTNDPNYQDIEWIQQQFKWPDSILDIAQHLIRDMSIK